MRTSNPKFFIQNKHSNDFGSFLVCSNIFLLKKTCFHQENAFFIFEMAEIIHDL